MYAYLKAYAHAVSTYDQHVEFGLKTHLIHSESKSKLLKDKHVCFNMHVKHRIRDMYIMCMYYVGDMALD